MRRRDRDNAGTKRQRPYFDSPRKISRKEKFPSPKRSFESDILTTVAPLESRRERSRWDIPPKGWEGLLAAQYKLTGLAAPGVIPDQSQSGKAVQEILSAPPLTSKASWVSRVVSSAYPGSVKLKEGQWLVKHSENSTGEEPKATTDPDMDTCQIRDYIHARPIETRFMQIILPLSGPSPSNLQSVVLHECEGVEKSVTSEVLPSLVRPKISRLFVQFQTAMECSNALNKLGGRLLGRTPLLVAALDERFAENYVFPQ